MEYPQSIRRASGILAMTLVCLLGFQASAQVDEEEETPVIDEQTAKATLRTCGSLKRIGQAILRERPSDELVKIVDVVIQVRRGLTEGKHGVHIHETGACEPCSAAGGHFDPGGHGNTNPDGNHPYHAGELPNINIDDISGFDFNRDGEPLGGGTLITLTTRISLSDGPLSIFDEDGAAIIIHTNPDSYCPDGEEAGCAGGGRAACGVLERDFEDAGADLFHE